MTNLVRLTVLVALLGMLHAPASALAQSQETSQRITTVGYGYATAPAATANLQFLIMYNYFYGAPAAGPVVEATPGAQVRSVLEPMVTAVQDIEGVEAVEVVVPVIPTYQKDPNILARLDVTYDSPTPDSLSGLYTQVSQIALDNRLMVGYVGASFTAQQCQALERDARQAALDDARMRAEIQADVLDASLGDVVASEDLVLNDLPITTAYGSLPPAGGACDPPTRSPSTLGQLYPGITLPPFDPNAQGAGVDVYRQVRITFELLPPA